jgi:hypothetical protein
MSTPIRTFIALTGELAQILTPGVGPAYDPSSLVDYVPPADVTTNVMGVPETKKIVSGMSSEATAGFTIDVTAKPSGLQPRKSRLLWRATEYVIIGVRERSYYRGEIDGYTLLLVQ